MGRLPIPVLSINLICSQHLEHLQLLLTEQTDVEPGSQILLLNVTINLETTNLHRKEHMEDLFTTQDTLLSKQVESNTPGTSFPETSDQQPV